MSNSTFYVSHAAIRNLKALAAHRIPHVSSSHLSEAIAAALGFNTYAALRSAFAQRSTVEVSKPSNGRLRERLRRFGYSAFPSVNLLPEFDCSYSPFKTTPLRAQKGIRWRAWRNLMVAAINAGLALRQFGLSPTDNWWEGGAPDSHHCERGSFRFLFDQETPAIACVEAISGDELSIYVVLNPKHRDVDPYFFHPFRDGEAYAHGWLERRLGVWIQDGGEDFSCRRVLLPKLAGLSIEPAGYSDLGSFIM